MKHILTAILAAVLAGCSTTLVRERPQAIRVGASQVDVTPLVEALLDLKGTRVQAVNGAWKENVFSAQCVMKGDGATQRIVFLAPQLRLATITLERPHTIRFERAPQIPRAFEPEYALADCAYVNLDAETLRRACGASLRVADDGVTRTVTAPDDTSVADLVRQANGDLAFTNRLHGYSYTLRPVTP